MKLLSFDVGIKNLAYCLLNDNKIEDWGIINISIEPVCDHNNCDKSAKKIYNDIKLCNNHIKLKKYKDKKMKNIPKIKNNILELGKNIINKLEEKNNFLEVDAVCIENQPALKNPTMKTVQMILYSYFLINGISTNKPINDLQMVNARNKLKVYNGPKIECDIKNKYNKNKFLAIQYCEYMIKEENNDFISLYQNSKKKDDLADAYLQGIYFNNK